MGEGVEHVGVGIFTDAGMGFLFVDTEKKAVFQVEIEIGNLRIDRKVLVVNA